MRAPVVKLDGFLSVFIAPVHDPDRDPDLSGHSTSPWFTARSPRRWSRLFPTRIRYTSMSLPYHIGNGWFGGLLPATSFAMVAADRRHLFRPLVPHRRCWSDARRRGAVAEGDEGRVYRLSKREIAVKKA
jgi:hypothetical protein